MCPSGYRLADLQQVIVRTPKMSLRFMCVALFLIPVSWPKGSRAASETCSHWTLSLPLQRR